MKALGSVLGALIGGLLVVLLLGLLVMLVLAGLHAHVSAGIPAPGYVGSLWIVAALALLRAIVGR